MEPEEALSPTVASLTIQRVWRGRSGRISSGSLAQDVFEKVFDPKNRAYYYYNKRLDKSRWTKPLCLVLCGRDIDKTSPAFSEIDAATVIQRFWRSTNWGDESDGESGGSNDSPTIAPRHHPRSMAQQLVDDIEDCPGENVCLNLSGLSLRRISSRIYDLGDKVTSADLSRNQLCRISPDIAELHLLVTLDISKNQITRLPKEIDEMCHLETLNMSFNKLESYPTTLYKVRCNIFFLRAGNAKYSNLFLTSPALA